jgi:integrase
MSMRRQGQIAKRGEQSWQLRWYVSTNPTGKRRYASRTVTGTKRDAERALRVVLQQHDRGVRVAPTTIRLDAYLDHWLADVAPLRRRAGTVAHYREMLARYVRPTLGAHRLDQLSPRDVQRLVADLERDGMPTQPAAKRGKRHQPGPLSPQTIRYAIAVLSAALEQAVRSQMIASNPARGVELPKRATQRRMRALTIDEAAKLREAASGDRFEALFLLLIGTGLRPGEALALRWADLDLDAGRLRVERSLGRRRKGEPWRFEDPKTSGSRRTVPLPATIVRALRAHRAAQAEERLAAGSSYADLDLAFSTPLGGPLDGRNVVHRHFKPMLLRAGLPATVRLYDLRHSAATHMLAGGASVRAVADRLGHASAKMTLDVYAHALPAQIDETTAILERALGGD